MTRKIQKRGRKREDSATRIFGLYKSIQAVPLPLALYSGKKYIQKMNIIFYSDRNIYFTFLFFFIKEWRSYGGQLIPSKALKDLISLAMQIPVIIR